MAYSCTQCGKTKRLPDFCCGKAMLSEGTYYCKQCGNTFDQAGSCCDQPLSTV